MMREEDAEKMRKTLIFSKSKFLRSKILNNLPACFFIFTSIKWDKFMNRIKILSYLYLNIAMRIVFNLSYCRLKSLIS